MEIDFAVIPTAFGEVTALAVGDRLISLRLGEEPGSVLAAATRTPGTRLIEHPAHPTLLLLAEQLDEYADGDRTTFSVPLDWAAVTGFTREALEAVCAIPFGETASYAEVAAAAGNPRAARAVGTACRSTPFSLVVPVHRVIRADGTLGGYSGAEDLKRTLIAHERAAMRRAPAADERGRVGS